jgi:hypothetical protein
MRRGGRILVLAMLLLGAGAARSVASPTPPQAEQPPSGATVTAGEVPTFVVQAPTSESVYLSVSNSPATDSNGTIGFDDDFALMTPDSSGTTYSYTPSIWAFPGSWLETPGTVYWQARYFTCDYTTNQCGYQVTSVETLNIAAPPPTASVGPPTNVGRTSARLNGAITANGLSASFYFEFGTTTTYGQDSGTGQAPATALDEPVWVDFSGLTPATVYHYRVVITTPSGTANSPDETFYTEPLDHTDSIPSWIGRQGGGLGFYVNTDLLPDGLTASRFRNIVDRTAERWGLADLGRTSATPAASPNEIDGAPEVGFTTDLPSDTLGELYFPHYWVRIRGHRACHRTGGHRRCHYIAAHRVLRLLDYDVTFNVNIPWSAAAWYPDMHHVDLESVVLHELGHFAGNFHHQPRCSDSPMVEALGPGEWWRAANEWWEFDCGFATDGRGHRGHQHRLYFVREISPEISPAAARAKRHLLTNEETLLGPQLRWH